MNSKACLELESKVISRDICTLCGACVGICPHIVAYRGRVLVRDACNLAEGRCTTYCPRISLNLDELSYSSFGVPYTWTGMGTLLGVFMARSTDAAVKVKAQDGGTVTALTRFALEEGVVDSAVVTLFEDKAFPQVRAVTDGRELLQCARSNYMATTTLEAFNRAVTEPERKRVALVGTPCQTLALAKMKSARPEDSKGVEKLGLVIGLFCTWALSYPAFADFLKTLVPDPIVKYKIPPPPANVLQVFAGGGQIDVPLDLIVPFIRPACRLCHDMTSEFADISVGAVELPGPPSAGAGELPHLPSAGAGEAMAPWNTVIVRTERGMRLLDSARSKGVIEAGELPRESLDHLTYAAINKKKRALQNIVKKTGRKEDLLYLKAESSLVATLLDE